MPTFWVLDPEIHETWADAYQVEARSPQAAASDPGLQVWDVLDDDAHAYNSGSAEVYVSDRPDGSGRVWAFLLLATAEIRHETREIEPRKTFAAGSE